MHFSDHPVLLRGQSEYGLAWIALRFDSHHDRLPPFIHIFFLLRFPHTWQRFQKARHWPFAFDLQTHRRSRPELTRQILRRIAGADSPVMDHDHAVADFFHLTQNVSREHHRLPVFQPDQHLADVPDLSRVQSIRRLIEDQKLRLMQQGALVENPLQEIRLAKQPFQKLQVDRHHLLHLFPRGD